MNTAVRIRMAGAKVLTVDLDPQCNMTYIMQADQARHTVLDVLTGQISAKEAVYHAPEGDILPGSPNLSLLERQLTGKDREMALARALEALAEDYHFVVVDSPPALGLLMMNALTAASSVVIPANADIFSMQGIGQLYTTIRAVQSRSNPQLCLDGILLCREDDGPLSRDVQAMLESTAQKMGTQLFESSIRREATVREAQAKRQSIYIYAPESGQAADYSRFTLEYLRRLRMRIAP